MHLTPADARRITGSYTVVRAPERPDVAAQSDPKVIETVSTMLSEIERDGLPAVRRYAERLDGWTGGEDFEVAEDTIGPLTDGLPADLARYVAEKGSIAVDGVSLTVTAVGDDWFEVGLIPETLRATVLGDKAVGDPVNLEVDVLAKYVERLLAASTAKDRA